MGLMWDISALPYFLDNMNISYLSNRKEQANDLIVSDLVRGNMSSLKRRTTPIPETQNLEWVCQELEGIGATAGKVCHKQEASHAVEPLVCKSHWHNPQTESVRVL